MEPLKKSRWRIASFLFLVSGVVLIASAMTHEDFSTRVVLSRAGLLSFFCSIGSGLLGKRQAVIGVWQSFILGEDGPINLAVARAVVFGLICVRVQVEPAVAYSALPHVFEPSWGMGWFVSYLPIEPETTYVCARALQVVSALAAIGLAHRITVPLATLLTFYVFGIMNMVLVVTHNDPHLLWFAMLLAVSPCADTLSIDAILGWTKPAPKCRAYALPLRFIWLLFGVLYFFPGFWKFWANGVDWFASNNMTQLIQTCWYRKINIFELPRFRADAHPLIANFAATSTILIEMGFIWLMFRYRTRLLAAGLGLAFHNSTRYFLKIGFHHLQGCYLLFVDWEDLWRRFRRKDSVCAEPVSAKKRSFRASLWVGSFLLVGNTIVGFSGVEDGWPLTGYPTFRELWKSEATSLKIVAYFEDGRVLELRDKQLRPPGFWVSTPRAFLQHAERGDIPALEALTDLLVEYEPNLSGVDRVEFYLDKVHISPELWEAPPVSRRKLFSRSYPRKGEASKKS